MHSTHYQANPDADFARAEIGRGPGIFLALLAALPIAGTLLVAQVLPQMEAAFAGTPDLRLRVALALTIPALAIAVCSWGAGWLADRVGRRRLLIGALVFYAAFGLAPLMLRSLDAIIAVRAGMGVTEGIIMTCSTALIGDLYTGRQREGLLSLQTACASIAAVLFALVGGALGELGWRAPFGVYAIALIFLPLLLWLVPSIEAPTSVRASSTVRSSLPVGKVLMVCLATFVLSICFYVAQIQIPYLLNALGPVSPSMVGIVSSLTNAAVVVGTLCFVGLRKMPFRLAGLLTFVLIALGLAIVGAAHGYGQLCTGLALASFAGGIALPTFLNGAMSLLSAEQRGLGTGMWQSSFWAGQFLSPIMVIALTAGTGSLWNAVTACAIGALVLGGLLSLSLRGEQGKCQ